MKCIFCRHDSPKDVQEVTDFVGDEQVDVAHARSVGSQYMNPVCKTIFSLTKSNSDLRFLTSFTHDYSVKYTGKPQGFVDAEKALKVALDAVARSFRSRGRAEALDPEMEAKRIGEARVRSLLFHVTNFTQIDITMAAFCIATKGRPYMTSHRSVNLCLYPLIAIVEGQRVSVTVKPAPGGGVRGSMAVTKYLSRDRRDLALFEFLVGGFSKKRNSTRSKKRSRSSAGESLFDDEAAEGNDDGEEHDGGADDEKYDDVADEFNGGGGGDNDDDDDYSAGVAEPAREATHVGCPSTPNDYVVVMHGFSFLPAVRLTTPEKIEKNALAKLLCFVPFDSLDKEHIIRESSSYFAAFEKAKADGLVCKLGNKYLANVESMWAGKIAAQERTKKRNQALAAEAQTIEALRGLADHKPRARQGADSDDDFNSESDNEDDADDADDVMGPTKNASVFASGRTLSPLPANELMCFIISHKMIKQAQLMSWTCPG